MKAPSPVASQGNTRLNQHHNRQGKLTLKVTSLGSDRRLPVIHGLLEGRRVNVLVDTGAQVTLVHQGVVPDNVCVTPTTKTVTGVTGAPLDIAGEAWMSVTLNNDTFNYQCVIVKDMEYDMLIGIDLLRNRKYVLDFSRSKGGGERAADRTFKTESNCTYSCYDAKNSATTAFA